MARYLLALLLLGAMDTAAAETDPRTGLIIADGWELVNAHCGACHSHRLVITQRGDADFWRSLIRWMQRTQNLWQIPEEQETKLIGYLAANYNETDWGRRPPLSPGLMPDNRDRHGARAGTAPPTSRTQD